MTRPIYHWATNDQGCSGRIRWITGCADFLIRRRKEKWSSDDIFLTGTKTESIAWTRSVEKRVQSICQGICGVG